MSPNYFTNGFLILLHRVVSEFRSLYQSFISESLTSNSAAAPLWALELPEDEAQIILTGLLPAIKQKYRTR